MIDRAVCLFVYLPTREFSDITKLETIAFPQRLRSNIRHAEGLESYSSLEYINSTTLCAGVGTCSNLITLIAVSIGPPWVKEICV